MGITVKEATRFMMIYDRDKITIIKGKEFRKYLTELKEKAIKGDSPGEYFTPLDILPEPLGQDVMDALGGLNCSDCYNNEIEESHENLTAWKKISVIKEWADNYIKRALDVDEANITLFRFEGEELLKILGVDVDG